MEQLPGDLDEDDILTADVVAFVNALLLAMLDDPFGPAATELLQSIGAALEVDLPDDPDDLATEIVRRAHRPAAIAGIAVGAAATIIRAARDQAGVRVNLEPLTSPYSLAMSMDWDGLP